MGTQYAAYTDETIWGIGDTGDEAREEGLAAIRENGAPESEAAALKIAPIDEDLVEALEEAEETGDEIMFDIVDGLLCEVEHVDEDEEDDGTPQQDVA